MRRLFLSLFVSQLLACELVKKSDSSAGEGGSAGAAGSSGASGDGAAPDATVTKHDFEDSGLGDWQVTDEFAQAGRSLRPPILMTGERSSITWACDDSEHTSFSFWFAGNADLYVDGELYEKLSSGVSLAGYFVERSIVVPDGEHEYRFEVVGPPEGGRPLFGLDTFVCARVEPYAVSSEWAFENSFAPLEFTGFEVDDPADRWQITNSAPQSGKFSVRPPLLTSGKSLALSTDCGDIVHSEFSFWFAGQADLYVDDELYESLNAGTSLAGYFVERSIVLPQDKHEYRFEVVGPAEGGRPIFGLDTVACSGD